MNKTLYLQQQQKNKIDKKWHDSIFNTGLFSDSTEMPIWSSLEGLEEIENGI